MAVPHHDSQVGLDLNDPFIMANDYIKHRLESAGIVWYDCPDLPDPTDARLAMRLLASDFERRYNSELAAMANELVLDVDTIYPTFRQAAEQLFIDGINWGRIVALFALGGALAAQCMTDGRRALVSQIADWVAIFVRDRLTAWIEQRGGWNAFVAWYDGPANDTSFWQSWRNIGLVAGAGIVGAVTISKALSR
uniref:Bcl-2 Bcl-2 homology region 1-3 domain-containing protein n=1 Tax=Plectus sambesii TaxID=2011161 RepID=A0A914UTR5_9BILA